MQLELCFSLVFLSYKLFHIRFKCKNYLIILCAFDNFMNLPSREGYTNNVMIYAVKMHTKHPVIQYFKPDMTIFMIDFDGI